jgi:hypothetical protein
MTKANEADAADNRKGTARPEKLVAELVADLQRNLEVLRNAGFTGVTLSQPEAVSRAIAGAAELCRGAAELAAGDAQAAISYGGAVTQSLEDFRNVWMHHMRKCLWMTTSGSQEFWQSRDLQQAAAAQRKLLLEAMNGWIECSVQMLQISTRIAENASKAIADRGGAGKG